MKVASFMPEKIMVSGNQFRLNQGNSTNEKVD